jgi:hypothetical protein
LQYLEGRFLVLKSLPAQVIRAQEAIKKVAKSRSKRMCAHVIVDGSAGHFSSQRLPQSPETTKPASEKITGWLF